MDNGKNFFKFQLVQKIEGVDLYQFCEDAMYMGVEQKMKQVDSKDKTKGSVPDAGKWSVKLYLTVKRNMKDGSVKEVNETIKVTISSATQPLENLRRGELVTALDFGVGFMGDGGQYYWARDIVALREVGAVGVPAAGHGQLPGQTSLVQE